MHETEQEISDSLTQYGQRPLARLDGDTLRLDGLVGSADDGRAVRAGAQGELLGTIELEQESREIN